MLGLRRPDEGSVALFGDPAHDCSAGERIGYVAQDATDMKADMPITVREVVAMGRYPRAGFGTLSDDDRAIVDNALERTDITNLAGRRLAQLSGGQRQRVFIARALAAEADLLALDEPTIGVDADSREQFYDLLHELNDQGITIVLIEHDIGVVTKHATQIVCMNREVYFHGNPAGFVESDALAQAYGANQRLLQHSHTQS
jgi:zinc transport system ATP-binding protein